MKPFSFRLERVLNCRRHGEQQARGKLVRIRNEYNGIKASVKCLASERSVLARECVDAGRGGIDTFRFRMYWSYMRKLARDIEKGKLELKHARARVKSQEDAVKQETIRRKALETLRDLRFRKHQEQIEREEQKALDELVINQRWEQT